MARNASRSHRGTLLALTTCSPMIGAAVLRDGEPVCVLESLQSRPNAQAIPHMVRRVCAAGKVAPADVDAIAITIGPGSFTGLRIGVTLVKALAFRRRLPIAAVSSLDAIAQNVGAGRVPVCVMLDAKQQKVYAAQYRWSSDGTLRRQGTEWLGPPEAWLRRLGPRDTWCLLGDGVVVYRALIEQRLGRRALIAPQDAWYPRVLTVARLGRELLRRGDSTDPITLLPRYLYHKECTVRRG